MLRTLALAMAIGAAAAAAATGCSPACKSDETCHGVAAADKSTSVTCEKISSKYKVSYKTQCKTFHANDGKLKTLAAAEAKCEKTVGCSGVSDLFCNGMHATAADNYALCMGAAADFVKATDGFTCVFKRSASVPPPEQADGYKAIPRTYCSSKYWIKDTAGKSIAYADLGKAKAACDALGTAKCIAVSNKNCDTAQPYYMCAAGNKVSTSSTTKSCTYQHMQALGHGGTKGVAHACVDLAKVAVADYPGCKGAVDWVIATGFAQYKTSYMAKGMPDKPSPCEVQQYIATVDPLEKNGLPKCPMPCTACRENRMCSDGGRADANCRAAATWVLSQGAAFKGGAAGTTMCSAQNYINANDKDSKYCAITGDKSKGNGKCVFPFTYNKVKYTSCTEADSAGSPWCSTSADGVYDSSKYAYCVQPSCAKCPKACTCKAPKCDVATTKTVDAMVKAQDSSTHFALTCTGDDKKGNNGQCQFPFIYKTKTYTSCTEADWAGHPWCSTNKGSTAYDGSKYTECKKCPGVTEEKMCSTMAAVGSKVDCPVPAGSTPVVIKAYLKSKKLSSCDKGSIGGDKSKGNGKCVFPFTYNKVKYTSCTEADSAGSPWCSTSADGVYDSSKYAYCVAGGTAADVKACDAGVVAKPVFCPLPATAKAMMVGMKCRYRHESQSLSSLAKTCFANIAKKFEDDSKKAVCVSCDAKTGQCLGRDTACQGELNYWYKTGEKWGGASQGAQWAANKEVCPLPPNSTPAVIKAYLVKEKKDSCDKTDAASVKACAGAVTWWGTAANYNKYMSVVCPLSPTASLEATYKWALVNKATVCKKPICSAVCTTTQTASLVPALTKYAPTVLAALMCTGDKKKGNNNKCQFPFVYKSVKYTACTEAAWAGHPWCSTNKGSEACDASKYVECTDCPRPKDDDLCVFVAKATAADKTIPAQLAKFTCRLTSADKLSIAALTVMCKKVNDLKAAAALKQANDALPCVTCPKTLTAGKPQVCAGVETDCQTELNYWKIPANYNQWSKNADVCPLPAGSPADVIKAYLKASKQGSCDKTDAASATACALLAKDVATAAGYAKKKSVYCPLPANSSPHDIHLWAMVAKPKKCTKRSCTGFPAACTAAQGLVLLAMIPKMCPKLATKMKCKCNSEVVYTDGKTYKGCTEADSAGSPWCSTDLASTAYNANKWAYCKDCGDPTDEELCTCMGGATMIDPKTKKALDKVKCRAYAKDKFSVSETAAICFQKVSATNAAAKCVKWPVGASPKCMAEVALWQNPKYQVAMKDTSDFKDELGKGKTAKVIHAWLLNAKKDCKKAICDAGDAKKNTGVDPPECVCKFPFTYNFKGVVTKHYGCTSDDHTEAWCGYSPTGAYDANKWANCKNCKSRGKTTLRPIRKTVVTSTTEQTVPKQVLINESKAQDEYKKLFAAKIAELVKRPADHVKITAITAGRRRLATSAGQDTVKASITFTVLVEDAKGSGESVEVAQLKTLLKSSSRTLRTASDEVIADKEFAKVVAEAAKPATTIDGGDGKNLKAGAADENQTLVWIVLGVGVIAIAGAVVVSNGDGGAEDGKDDGEELELAVEN